MRSLCGAAFIHVLNEASETLAEPCVGWGEFPWGFTIAAFSILIMMNIEFVMDSVISGRAAKPADTDKDVLPSSKADIVDGSEPDEVTRRQNVVRSLSLELGVVVHSVFIGVALGVTQERSAITSLAIAIMCHQLVEGIVIGTMFIGAKFSAVKYTLLGLVYTFITPIGVAIGIAVGSERYSSTRGALITDGVLNSAASGVLVFNGLVDIVLPAFSADGVPDSFAAKVLGFVLLYLGAGIMALIGKWA